MVLRCKFAACKNNSLLIACIIAFASVFHSGCTVSYSFSGANISADVSTISVQYFQNRASLVQPGLSQYITDALIDKCKAQTSKSIINGVGDVNFEGEITDYKTVMQTTGSDARAATNRFTISVNVKFTNSVDPDLSYEKTFTRYEDYSTNLDFASVEKDLSDKIVAILVEDIFNEAFVTW